MVGNDNTVVIIEHNLDIIRYAGWVIDMGPEGGKNGGNVLIEGIPEDLVKCQITYREIFKGNNLSIKTCAITLAIPAKNILLDPAEGSLIIISKAVYRKILSRASPQEKNSGNYLTTSSLKKEERT